MATEENINQEEVLEESEQEELVEAPEQDENQPEVELSEKSKVKEVKSQKSNPQLLPTIAGSVYNHLGDRVSIEIKIHLAADNNVASTFRN